MIPFIIWACLISVPLLIWLIFRSGGYKRRPLDAPPGPDWQKNGERFIDPKSGEELEVWTRLQSGERAYVRARRSAS
jgi:hypothetical protein